MQTALIIISLVYMLFVVLSTAVPLKRLDRRGRCKMLHNYKKGKFAAIFIAFFPLYVAAYTNAGHSLFRVIITSFHSSLATVAFSYDLDIIEPLAKTNSLFAAAIALCIVLSIVNAGLFSFSLLFRWRYNRKKLKVILSAKRPVTVIVGYGRRAAQTISTIDTKASDLLVLCPEVTPEIKEEMYASAAAYIHYPKGSVLSDTLATRVGSFNKRHCTVILLSDYEKENITAAFQAASLAESLGKDICMSEDGGIGLEVYLLSDSSHQSIYRRITKISHGAVHCVNKYQAIAMDFTNRYPVTLNIPHLIDTEHAAFVEGCDIRTVLIGFGRVNRQLFRIYNANNQCMVMQGSKPTLVPMRYYVFDKKTAFEDAAFCHSDMHYNTWLKDLGDSSDYFELPTSPATVDFNVADINSPAFLPALKAALTTSPTGYNNVIIAIGKDAEAMDLAERIAEISEELGCNKQISIYLRVRDTALLREIENHTRRDIPIIPFGDDLSVYSYQRIVNPEIESLAMYRHLSYATEGGDSKKTDSELRREATEQWLFEWQDVQRNSNIFAILSIRVRLQLLGFDCVPKSSSLPDASDEFEKAYNLGNKVEHKEQIVNEKKLVDYSVPYNVPGTPRTVLAEAEHYRWNAYYIASGFVPASKSEFKNEGKTALMRRRKHINLTTVNGLMDYDEWRWDKSDPKAKKPDIVKYDYQLMDDVTWLLSRIGYKIVKRQNDKELI